MSLLSENGKTSSSAPYPPSFALPSPTTPYFPDAASSTSPRRPRAAAPQKLAYGWGHLRASCQPGRSSTFHQSSPGHVLPRCQPSPRTMPRVCFGRAPGTRNELQSSPGAVSALPKPAAQRACEKQNANSATVSGTEGARSYAAAPRRSLQIKHAERKAHAPGLVFPQDDSSWAHTSPKGPPPPYQAVEVSNRLP